MCIRDRVIEDKGFWGVKYLLWGNGGEKAGDDGGGFRAGVNVVGEALTHRIQSIPHQQHPVKLHLDLCVGDAAGIDLFVDIAVAGLVQGEVAQKAVEIGQVSRGVVQTVDQLGRRGKKVLARLIVGAEPQLTDGVGPERVVVKQQIRPVKAHGIQVRVALDDRLNRLGQAEAHVPAKPMVCVGGRHRGSPLSLFQWFPVLL